jgi:cyanophycinase
MPGVLMAIGGAEDKLGRKSILGEFVRLAGGADARIVVISTASALGDEATDLYRRLFTRYGVGEVRGLRPVTRREADDARTVAALDGATGVFMTGGNQVRLSTVVAGTALGTALHEAHLAGAVIGGTSAGASALSSHMVAFGAAGAVPRQRMAQMCAGLGLLPGVIVDQHFEERSRIGRLIALVALSPSLLGIGIDEDTAALFHPDATFEVIGKGTVTVVDGRDVESDAFEANQTAKIMVSGAVLHSVPAGWSFDLEARRVAGRASRVEGVVLPAGMATAGPSAGLVRRLAAEGADDRVVQRRARQRARRAAARGEEASE